MKKTYPDNNVSEKGKERIPIPSNSESSRKIDKLLTENKVVDRRYLKKKEWVDLKIAYWINEYLRKSTEFGEWTEFKK